MRKQNGITLIALVITIIVLLILAGVSIAMLTGENGLLTQANNSKAETAKAEAVERINLTLNAIKSHIYAEQVEDANWVPVDEEESDKIKEVISNLIKSDLGTDATNTGTATDGKYDYNYANTLLTISYVDSTSGLTTAVSGSIKLEKTGNTDAVALYTINAAK